MTSTAMLDQVAAALRDAYEDNPDPLLDAAADEVVAIVCSEVRDLPAPGIGAVLMHVALLAEKFAAHDVCAGECALSRFSDAAAVAGLRLYGGAR